MAKTEIEIGAWDKAPAMPVAGTGDPKLELLNAVLVNGMFDRLANGKVWKPTGPVTDKYGNSESFIALVQEYNGNLAITLQSGNRPHERRFLADGYGDFYMDDDKRGMTIPIKPLTSDLFRNKYHATIQEIVDTRLRFIKQGHVITQGTGYSPVVPPVAMELVWLGVGMGYDYQPVKY